MIKYGKYLFSVGQKFSLERKERYREKIEGMLIPSTLYIFFSLKLNGIEEKRIGI